MHSADGLGSLVNTDRGDKRARRATICWTVRSGRVRNGGATGGGAYPNQVGKSRTYQPPPTRTTQQIIIHALLLRAGGYKLCM